MKFQGIMVVSKLNPTIRYNEVQQIDPEDNNIESSPYDVIFNNIDPKKNVTIVFGNPSSSPRLVVNKLVLGVTLASATIDKEATVVFN